MASVVCSVDRITIYTTTMSTAAPAEYNTLVRPQVITLHLTCMYMFVPSIRLSIVVSWKSEIHAFSFKGCQPHWQALSSQPTRRFLLQSALVGLNIMSMYRFIIMWRLYNQEGNWTEASGGWQSFSASNKRKIAAIIFLTSCTCNLYVRLNKMLFALMIVIILSQPSVSQTITQFPS